MLARLEKRIFESGVSNEFLVQLIELSGSYLGLQTIPDYARNHNLSYNGVKKARQKVVLFGVRFVVDNG